MGNDEFSGRLVARRVLIPVIWPPIDHRTSNWRATDAAMYANSLCKSSMQMSECGCVQLARVEPLFLSLFLSHIPFAFQMSGARLDFDSRLIDCFP